MPRELKKTKNVAKRRGNNEGSIHQHHDGCWCGQVTIGYKTDGKPIRKTLYGKTRQEVASGVTKHTNEVFESGYTSISASDTQEFSVLYKDWFDTFKAPNIAPQTQERYINFMKNHFNPAFGTLKVKDIDLNRFQRFFNEKAKKGYAMQTIKHMKQALNQFYEYAVRKKLVAQNPIVDVKIRDSGKHNDERMALTPVQRETILSLLDEETLLKPILLTLEFTGLRPQELMALKWKNINIESSVISIEAATNRDILFDDNGNVIKRRIVLGKTKTAGSVRSFITPEVVMDCLKEWKEYQLEQEQKTGISFTAGDCFVFSTKKGTMRTYSGLRSLLVRFLRRNGLENEGISLYTFRHTFATILLEERENPKIVASLMGHKKVSTTLDIYSHVVSNSVYEETAQKLNSIYTEITQNKYPPAKPGVFHVRAKPYVTSGASRHFCGLPSA